MFTLRCTRQLLARIKVRSLPDAPPPTTRLGDWSAKIVYPGGPPLVLAVAHRTFLAVVVPAAPFATLLGRVRTAVGDVLSGVGVHETDVARELREMEDAALGATSSRQVTGVMVDFAKSLPYYLERDASLARASLVLSETPCGPLYRSSVFPDKATRELFGGLRRMPSARGGHLTLVN